MKNEINAVLENMTAATPEPEDYTGEDGLLYCGKCRKPKEMCIRDRLQYRQSSAEKPYD